ncbi:MAG: SWIM zinc finger family protein [Planctomycetaceae bacterium]|jgi:uncharacterized Zn finger protein
MSWGYEFREYVPVARRKALAAKLARKMAKQAGRDVQPVSITGRQIAKTFWGQAWCDHLESYSDYANRLPRGRTYVRNGSIADLHITAGTLDAIVAGSEPYKVRVDITPLTASRWKKLRRDCSASIDSLLDLLAGRFSDGVMQRLTDRAGGVFPAPKEIRIDCSCPDWANVCKHAAAVLYGVGSLLDAQPELLFMLRDVDHSDLISAAVSASNLSTALGEPSRDLADEDLGAMFGIELDVPQSERPTKRVSKKAHRTSKEKPTPKAAAKQKSAPGVAKTATPVKKKKKTGRNLSVSGKAAKKKTSGKRVAATKVAKKRPATKKAASTRVSPKKAVKQKPVTRDSATKKSKKSGKKTKRLATAKAARSKR